MGKVNSLWLALTTTKITPMQQLGLRKMVPANCFMGLKQMREGCRMDAKAQCAASSLQVASSPSIYDIFRQLAAHLSLSPTVRLTEL